MTNDLQFRPASRWQKPPKAILLPDYIYEAQFVAQEPVSRLEIAGFVFCLVAFGAICFALGFLVAGVIS